ncbi:MAG: hypothetical protein B5M48_01320 [Candidatus Omnitrophica bacterium 4484_213]|nr:MAG: hypothetical protein B5M48_01320 [Candidatus Omnitrophica bacterium 4484_213]
MDSENIEYDYEKYEKKWSSIFTPAETLSKRKRVCNDSGLEAYMQNYLYKRIIKMSMKPTYFTQHSLDQMHKRKAAKREVEITIRESEWDVAGQGRWTAAMSFDFNAEHYGRFYRCKEVVSIFVEENERIAIITVYTFFITGGKMKIKYDPEADAVYITLKGREADHTLRVGPDFAVDYGPDGEVHGIEILSAKKHLKLSPRHQKIKLENLMLA